MLKIFILLLATILAKKELKFVAVFCRHGARSPLVSIEGFDKKTNWNYGYGELTPSGQRQLYLLGRVLRKRYVEDKVNGTHSFLPEDYNETLLFVRSTAFHRTIMSVNALLNGLYPSNASELNDTQLKNKETWLPPIGLNHSDKILENLGKSALPHDIPVIPVKNYLKSQDKLLKMDSCLLYNKHRSEYFDSKKAEDTYKKYKPDIDVACGLLNADCGNLKGNKTFLYCDYIVASEFDGQMEKISQNDTLVQKIRECYTRSLKEEITYNPIMPKIIMNSFKREIQSRFNDSIKNIGPKMVLYGTHDDLILGYLDGLDLDNIKKENFTVEYASHIIIEFWETENGHMVNLSYNGDVHIYEDLNKFNKTINEKGKLDGTWEEACNPKNSTNETNIVFLEESSTDSYIILFCVLALAFVIMIVVAAKKYSEKRSEASEPMIRTEITTYA